MASGTSDYLRVVGSSVWIKKNGQTPMGGGGITSLVSIPSIKRAQEHIKRCFSCTSYLTCSAKGPSDQSCECRNVGQHYTRCYFWAKCKNKGQLMSSSATVRGLLGHFARNADQPNSVIPSHPRLSSCQHICPYGKYWRPGPGEDERGVARADAGFRKRESEGDCGSR